MLDAFIIEELKRREEARRQSQQRPCLEVPESPEPPEPEDRQDESAHDEDDAEGDSRGVIIIDFSA